MVCQDIAVIINFELSIATETAVLKIFDFCITVNVFIRANAMPCTDNRRSQSSCCG